ncbi:hypothetical protein, partial [Arthrobacter sp. SO3]|uniref:hypothetical protein n=1 Tax=Arthrobacter sp. SO3 TaxID=1897057 RepID=UPI001CFF81D2
RPRTRKIPANPGNPASPRIPMSGALVLTGLTTDTGTDLVRDALLDAQAVIAELLAFVSVAAAA